MLLDLGEPAAARDILQRDLLWLLDRDAASLDATQRAIREFVSQTMKGVRLTRLLGAGIGAVILLLLWALYRLVRWVVGI